MEPILETKYTMEPVPDALISKWSQYMNMSVISADSANSNTNKNINGDAFPFHLPSRNVFIPTDLNLLSNDEFSSDSLHSHFLDIENVEHCGPELLVYSESMKLFYKLDRTYFVPKGYIVTCFEHHSVCQADCKRIVSLQILVDQVQYLYTSLILSIHHVSSWYQCKLWIYVSLSNTSRQRPIYLLWLDIPLPLNERGGD